MGPSELVRVALTGQATPVNSSKLVGTVSLSAIGADATVVLRNGNASGDVLLTVAALANTTVPVQLHGAQFDKGIYATLTGAGAEVSIELV